MDVAAVDLGAGSGRVVRGTVAGGRIALAEIHRFRNEPVFRGAHLRWDLPGILGEVTAGLARAAAAGPLAALGVCGFGVDFVLFDAEGRPLEDPVCYRDARTEGMVESLARLVSPAEHYARTGTQFLRLNTVYQLHALARHDPAVLARARRLLLLPDALHFLLGGEAATEFTNATTTGLLSAARRDFDPDLLRAVPVDPALFTTPVPPGTPLGRARSGAPGVPVIAPATHDTASAVAGVPAERGSFAFVSAGTWCLAGVETAAPVLTAAARERNFTNEGGVAGTWRFLRNVTGLWLMRGLAESLPDAPSCADLERLAAAAAPATAAIDPDDPLFFAPPSMSEAIVAFCAATGQEPPAGPGDLARAAYEGIALALRRAIEDAAGLAGTRIDRVHLVGGGSRDALLCRLTAEATGRPVLAGPAEATAAGNVLMQAMALGAVGDLAEARAVLRRSSPPVEYTPSGEGRLEEAYQRYSRVREARRERD